MLVGVCMEAVVVVCRERERQRLMQTENKASERPSGGETLLEFRRQMTMIS